MPLQLTRIKVLMTIYASGVWDSMRTGYIESCREEYEEYNRNLPIRSRAESCFMPGLDGRPVPEDDEPFEFRRSYSYEQRSGHHWVGQMTDGDLDNLMKREFDCPLPAMPRFIRLYRRFSNIFVTVNMIKYGLLAAIQYGWINVDKVYACYVPGRSALALDFVYEMPWFGLLIFAYHVATRLLVHLQVKRLNIDCFMFLLYDKDTIVERQFGLVEMNSTKLTPREAYRRYLCNRVFYERQVDSRGRARYVMRQQRTIEHYERLRSANLVFYIFCMVMLILGIPAYIYSVRTHLSHEFFDLYYPACRSFSNSPNNGNFSWSFGDKYRLFNLFFDRLDNEILTIDTVISLILPLVLVTLTHDLRLRFDDICTRVASLNERFRYLLLNDDLVRDMVPFERPPMKFIEDLEEESRAIFEEVIGIFKQVKCDDEYIRRVTLIMVCIWFFATMSINTFVLLRLGSRRDNSFMVYLIAEVYYHTGMASLLALMTRPHNRAKLLYNRLCSAMALCPDEPETRIRWRWLVEYYHRGSSRYSLHFVGKGYAFSNLNIIRCMSWFVSCTVIMLNLIRNKLPDQVG